MGGLNKKKIYIITFSSIALLCLFGFIWSWYVTRDIRKNVQGALNQSQRVEVKHLILTETKNEQKYWELYARTGTYDSSRQVVVLTEIIGNFYDKEKRVALSFESPRGTYDESNKFVTLEGRTLIVSKDGSSILADKITWGGKDTNIIASGNVQITRDKDFATTSKNAEFNSDLTFFKIIGDSQVQIFAPEGSKQKDINLLKGNK